MFIFIIKSKLNLNNIISYFVIIYNIYYNIIYNSFNISFNYIYIFNIYIFKKSFYNKLNHINLYIIIIN